MNLNYTYDNLILLFTDSIQNVLDANNIFTIAKRTVEGQVMKKPSFLTFDRLIV